MSTPQAIAGVTAILVEEVTAALPDYSGFADLVTAGHPQVSRGDRTDPQVNLFLYQISPDAKWRNQDVPGKPGTYPLLALRLSYLVTAFGQDDDDRQAHDLLGAVMHRFHTNPIIPRTIADPVVTASGLAAQYEPVRLTLQPLTLNDLSQIWSGSPSPYRLSVGYEASVVLIDSGKAAKAAPPVLGRGTPGDPGFGADPLAGEPTLGGTQFPDGLSGIQPAPAALGTQKWVPDLLTLTGTVLNNPDLRLVFRHPQLGFAYIATPRQPAAGPTQLQVRVPHDLTVYRNQPGQPLGAIEVAANLVPATDPTAWPPGIYTVAAARAVRAGGAPPDRLYTTAPLAFGLLPQVDTTAAPFRVAFVNSTATPPVPTDATMTARLVNPVSLTSGQQVRLFAGGLELLGQVTSADGLALSWEAADPVQLQTDLAAAAAGGEALFLRVQVDGVDSSMLQPLAAGATAPPRAFNPALLVQVS